MERNSWNHSVLYRSNNFHCAQTLPSSSSQSKTFFRISSFSKCWDYRKLRVCVRVCVCARDGQGVHFLKFYPKIIVAHTLASTSLSASLLNPLQSGSTLIIPFPFDKGNAVVLCSYNTFIFLNIIYSSVLFYSLILLANFNSALYWEWFFFSPTLSAKERIWNSVSNWK